MFDFVVVSLCLGCPGATFTYERLCAQTLCSLWNYLIVNEIFIMTFFLFGGVGGFLLVMGPENRVTFPPLWCPC